MIQLIQEVMNKMDKFESSRPGSIAFTHLEEAVMWLQVMTNRIPLKQEENKVEPVSAV